MNITVYADESGTHDFIKTRQPGSEMMVIGGYAGYPNDWAAFRGQWKTTLDKYKAPYFHFSEFANKHVCKTDSSSPCFQWDEKRRHEFLFELAHIAGTGSGFHSDRLLAR